MNYYDKCAALYWVSLLGKPNHQMQNILRQRYGSVEEAFIKAGKEKVLEIDDGLLSASIREKLFNEELKNYAKKAIYDSVAKKIMPISFDSPIYPANLLNTDDYPLIIFAIGKLNLLKTERKILAVVGSRKCTAYGRNVVKSIVNDLKGYDISIVSGMAKGIDAASQYAGLDAGLPTIAVLGSGPDICYPEENTGLYNRLKENGVIISEYAAGTGPKRHHFPARNRIIAGMCDSVLVCEAGYGSGAIITAERAADYGRDVLAIPGNIDVAANAGTNDLIKKGAGLTTSYHEVLYSLGIEDDGFGAKETDISNLNDAQRAVYITLKEAPADRDEISRRLNIDAVTLGRILTTLSIYGFIKRLDDGTFAA